MADNKSFKLLKRIMIPIESISEFVKDYYNLLVDDLNKNLQNLSLSRNFESEIFENVEIAATSTLRISHKLGIIPKFRLVLKQSGGGLITDGNFTNSYVELYNSGASIATISFILLKE